MPSRHPDCRAGPRSPSRPRSAEPAAPVHAPIAAPFAAAPVEGHAAPESRPVHQEPVSTFQPAEVQSAQQVRRSTSQEAPITGVPMSFPADLRGPTS
ncbi:hypothetical protein NKG05_18195 [Oerskovia sp. M15]